MSTKIVNLKYAFDVKNLKPFETSVRDTFSSKKQTTYNVTSFSSIKYECPKFIRDLKAEKPELQDFDFEIYAKYAVSKLPETTTIVNQLRFNVSINKYKKFIYVNMELCNNGIIEETKPTLSDDDEDITEEVLIPKPSPAPLQKTRRLVAVVDNE